MVYPIPLSVITATHNHGTYLKRYMQALLPACEQIGAEIILIDNLSDDNSVTLIRQYPQVQLHINHTRRGFSANNNYCMAMAKGQYILLLNPDTEVQPNAFKN
jgi:hypothetical protein